MIPFLVSLAGGTLKDWVSSKSKINEAKEIAKAENAGKGISGWSDEYLVLVWSYPLIAAFVPALQPSVAAGFEYMSSLPEWYVGGFISISFAVFGIDKIFRWRSK